LVIEGELAALPEVKGELEIRFK